MNSNNIEEKLITNFRQLQRMGGKGLEQGRWKGEKQDKPMRIFIMSPMFRQTLST